LEEKLRTVYKYQIKAGFITRLEIPYHARIVHAEYGPDTSVTFWAEVDTESPLEIREFQIFGTGHEIPRGGEWIDTVRDGIFVWHVYELIDPEARKIKKDEMFARMYGAPAGEVQNFLLRWRNMIVAIRSMLDPSGQGIRLDAEWAEVPYYRLKCGESTYEDEDLETLILRAAESERVDRQAKQMESQE
jgi:hypothetical protein